jgi:hypothetical protein
MIAASVAICAMPLSVVAQQAQAPSQVPPELERLEEGEAPAITIRRPESERQITEKRERGLVTEIKVQSGNGAYYLRPNQQVGSAVPGDTESNLTRAPQWQVLEFSTRRAKDAQETATQTPAPPAAAPSSPAKK